MKRYRVLVTILVLTVWIHLCVLSQSIKVGDSEVNSLIYMGSVDGKSYFYEKPPLRTWLEAREACNFSNMVMATITSERQAAFLFEATNFDNYTNNGFWTAGRLQLSKPSISEFRWDTDNTSVSNHGTAYYDGDPIERCLAYNPRVTIGELYSMDCERLYGILCEAYHNT